MSAQRVKDFKEVKFLNQYRIPCDWVNFGTYFKVVKQR